MNPNESLDLLTRLLHRIAPEVSLANVDPDGLLQEEMDLDSMDFLNLVTALHDDAGIDIPESDYPKLATLRGFTAYVSAASAGTAAPTAS